MSEVVPSSQLSTDGQLQPLVVYLVRHAEARHNVEEKRVVEQASLSGATKEQADEARKAALWADESLRDATLSQEGAEQVGASALGIKKMLSDTHYGPPELVLVSPLRRTLQTATGLFGADVRVSAIEALREKRTGMACDERHSVLELQAEFPHIDFSEMRKRRAEFPTPEHGEDNAAVRRRALAFLDGLPALAAGCSTIAIVSHKGWLRELRAGLLAAATAHGELRLDFDLDLESQPVLFGNAEVRVAEFSWRRQGQVVDGLLHDDGLVLGAIVSLRLRLRLGLRLRLRLTPAPHPDQVLSAIVSRSLQGATQLPPMTVARVHPAWSSPPLRPAPEAARPGGGSGGGSSTRPLVAVASVAEADTAAAVDQACCQLDGVLGTSADRATEAAAETAAGGADAADVADAADAMDVTDAADEDPLLVLAFGEVAMDPAALARALRARLGKHARLVGCSSAPAGVTGAPPEAPPEPPRLTLFGMRCARRCGVGMADGATADAFAAAAAAARAAIAPLHVHTAPRLEPLTCRSRVAAAVQAAFGSRVRTSWDRAPLSTC